MPEPTQDEQLTRAMEAVAQSERAALDPCHSLRTRLAVAETLLRREHFWDDEDSTCYEKDCPVCAFLAACSRAREQ